MKEGNRVSRTILFVGDREDRSIAVLEIITLPKTVIHTRGATRRVPRHERAPAESWRPDSDSPPGNPAFQGTGTGSTGYLGKRTAYGPDYGRQAGLTSG